MSEKLKLIVVVTLETRQTRGGESRVQFYWFWFLFEEDKDTPIQNVYDEDDVSDASVSKKGDIFRWVEDGVYELDLDSTPIYNTYEEDVLFDKQ